MNEIPFQIVLQSPVQIGDESSIHRAGDGRLFITSTAVKAVMRRHLRGLMAERGIDPELEREVFGELTDYYATRSKFSVSSLLTSSHVDAAASIPAGTRFTGKLLSEAIENSSADFAIRLSLLLIFS